MPAEMDVEDGEVDLVERAQSPNGSDEDALGQKRKHKKKDKKEHKIHKDKKHKKHRRAQDSDDDDVRPNKDVPELLSKETLAKASAKTSSNGNAQEPSSPRRDRPSRDDARGHRSRSASRGRRDRDRRRSRTPPRRSRTPPRRRSPPRGGRSPPRRYGDRRSPPRGDRFRRDGRGDRDGYRRGDNDQRRDERSGMTEERRADELRKEREREVADAKRKKEEEEEYARRVAEKFEEMDEDGSDMDEEEKVERERQERRKRMERIKAASDAKRQEEEAAAAAGPPAARTPPPSVAIPDEEAPAEDVDLLAGLTPRQQGEDGDRSGSDSEDDRRAGDVDEITEEAQDDRAKVLSPRSKAAAAGSAAGRGEKIAVFDMFGKDDKIDEKKKKAKAIERGDNKMLADNFDDADGYLTFQMGETFHGRYMVDRVLGKGVFSTVLGAKDTENPGQSAAIKIIRNNDMMAKCAAKELEMLKLLAKDGGADRHHIVQLTDDFVHHGHMCLVFEPMAMNLREVIKKFGNNRGINIEGVQIFAKQMFQGLKHLRKCKIVHADIKPDNILINERHNAIKICDFGSGSYINECDITPYLVSRWYRAPEITLCLRYDYSIDLWSIASCLYELYVGKVMFPGNANNDMLRRFMEIKGRFPNKLIKRSMQKQMELGRTVDFTEDFKFLRIMIDKITKKETVKIITIEEKPVKDLLKLLQPSSIPADQARKVKQLCDLLHGCLMLNPDNRLSIEQCLSHAFIKEPLGYQPKRKVPPPPPGGEPSA